MHYIKLTENVKNTLYNQFKNYIDTTKFAENRIDFETALLTNTELPKANLFITAKAYLKMMLYVRDTNTEIAWHGTVSRTINQAGIATYVIEDVMLYPQVLATTTVNTDQEKYQNWLINLDDDTANNLRMQGHSHPTFSVTPSGTDRDFYEEILKTIPKDGFYIFLILNKSGEMYRLIYDLKQNLVYENNDINVEIADKTNMSWLNSITREKEQYCEKPKYTAYGRDNLPYCMNFPTEKYNSIDEDDEDPFKNYTYYKQNKKKEKKGKEL